MSDTIPYFSLLPNRAGACDPGYVPYTANRAVSYPVARELTMKCDPGYYYKNNTCVAYTQGGCLSGYYDETPAIQDSMFDMTYGGKCTGGMEPMLSRLFAAYAVRSSVAHCGAGYYPTTSGCAAHATDNCPTNYYAITPATAFVRGDENDECATNYSLYNDTDFCLKFLGNNMSELCTPQLTCNAGVTTFRTSTGIILPLYRDRVTTPSLNFLIGNGNLCFVNLVPGNARGAINFNYNGTVYHGAE